MPNLPPMSAACRNRDLADQPPRILACIATYGFKNQRYLDRVLDEYRRMPFEVKIVVVTDQSRHLGSDVEIRVGIPGRSPHTLPFAHKRVLAENVDAFDLFIYSEDDMLITTANIETFLEFTRLLPEDRVSGFLRYEVDFYGHRFFPDAQYHYSWLPDSVEEHGGQTFAQFGNLHSASYVLTQAHLKMAMASDGFLVCPHRGDYDYECSAATDVYTQCGLTRLICISRVEDVAVWHLPNVYVGRTGIPAEEMQRQIAVLGQVLKDDRLSEQLFQPRPALSVRHWDRHFYETPDAEIVRKMQGVNRRILSIGTGSGALEGELKKLGHDVTGVPLDYVVAESAKYRGVDVTRPSFTVLDNEFADDRFDTVIACDVLQYAEQPAALLERFVGLVSDDGELIVKIPNFGFWRFRRGVRRERVETCLSTVSVKSIVRFMTNAGFACTVAARGSYRLESLHNLFGAIVPRGLARSFVIAGTRSRRVVPDDEVPRSSNAVSPT